MPISVQLNAAFNVDSKTYTADMSLPSSSPTAADPFVFTVTSAPFPQTTPNPTPAITLLTVAVGTTSQVYVAVAPPTDLINSAAGSNIVAALDVVVSEGTYDPKTGTFSTT